MLGHLRPRAWAGLFGPRLGRSRPSSCWTASLFLGRCLAPALWAWGAVPCARPALWALAAWAAAGLGSCSHERRWAACLAGLAAGV